MSRVIHKNNGNIYSLFNNDYFNIIALLTVSSLLFMFNLGGYPLFDPDEAIHAQIAKTIVDTGNWITPTFNGQNFYDKPILYFWMNAASFSLFGVSEFAARLPAAVFGILGVILTYFIGKNLFDRATALLSGLILTTSFEYIILSRIVVHDITLAIAITASLLFFYLGYNTQNKKWIYHLPLYVFLGIGSLAKGPIGILLPAGIIFLFLSLSRELRELKKMGLWWGIPLTLLVASPWYVLIAIKNPDYLYYFFINQNIDRFLSPYARHAAPFYFYIPILVGGILPWTFFLIQAIGHMIPRRFTDLNEKKEMMFLMCWLAVIFLFFSVASSKLITYILPVFPSVALMLGKYWKDYIYSDVRYVKGVSYALYVFSGTLVCFSIGLIFYVRYSRPEYIAISIPVAIFMLVLSVISVFYTYKDKRFSQFVIVGIFMVFLIFYSNYYIMPEVGHYRSTRELSDKINTVLKDKEPLCFYDGQENSIIYYTGRSPIRIPNKRALQELLNLKERQYIIMKIKDYKELKDIMGKRAKIIMQEGKYLLLEIQKV